MKLFVRILKLCGIFEFVNYMERKLVNEIQIEKNFQSSIEIQNQDRKQEILKMMAGRQAGRQKM